VRLMLASASPRRAEILHRLGLDFEVEAADVDETRRPDEAPLEYVERLARAKAVAVVRPGILAIGFDTVVVHDGKVMGKPAHPEEARSMLRRLQGESHEVMTGLAVAGTDGGQPQVFSTVDVTEVLMTAMTEEEIDDYVDSGEPMDKAGAYALQGFGGVFVQSVRGSAHNVVGIPVHLLGRLVERFDQRLGDFRRPQVT
jgi:septum formation protein